MRRIEWGKTGGVEKIRDSGKGGGDKGEEKKHRKGKKRKGREGDKRKKGK